MRLVLRVTVTTYSASVCAYARPWSYTPRFGCVTNDEANQDFEHGPARAQ